MITRPVETITELIFPTNLAEELGPEDAVDVVWAVNNFAPELNSVNPTAASQLHADLDALRSQYESTRPVPAIETQVLEVIDATIPDIVEDPENLWASVQNDLNPFEPTSALNELAALVSPYPSLSSEIMQYLSVAKSYDAPLLLAEASLVSKDLSVTAALPTWLSCVTQAMETSTSAGGRPAAPTAGAAVVMNAGAAAAGMAVLALL